MQAMEKYFQHKGNRPSYPIRIWMAGDVGAMRWACGEFCAKEGLCVTVTPTTYVYTGGEEAGACIGLMNYPRFHSTPNELKAKAIRLAHRVAEHCHQSSFSIEAPDYTYWYSRRSE